MLNKIKISKIIGIGSLCLFLLGCSDESFQMQDEENSTNLKEEVMLLSNVADGQKQTETDLNADELEAREQVEESAGAESKASDTKEIVVHICGAVKHPGVYHLTENQRLYEGINLAGGFREDADEDYLNQALRLEDGMKIVVPTIEETAQLKEVKEEPMITEENFLQKGQPDNTESRENSEGKVNLNTADEALLCTLPGIGESRAKSIIAYRKEHGPFQKTEDVMKVSGIKEVAFTKIKEYVTVSE